LPEIRGASIASAAVATGSTSLYNTGENLTATDGSSKPTNEIIGEFKCSLEYICVQNDCVSDDDDDDDEEEVFVVKAFELLDER
jgi:hypothetical protein